MLKKKRGTADLNLGQYNEVLGIVQRALPKALIGIPYEDLSDIEGDELEPCLRQALLDATKKQTKPISPKDMELVDFLAPREQGEERKSYVSGDKIRQLAKELNANGGKKQAQEMLDRQDEIPKEFRPYWLIFPGDVEIRDGDRGVSCLYWHGSRWCLGFYWLEDDFSSDYRLVRPRESHLDA